MQKSKKLFKNKFFLFFSIVFLITFIGGLFWWQADNFFRFVENKKVEKMVAPSKDYLVVENIDGKFIINEKDGLTIKILTDWDVKKNENRGILESDREVILFSKDFNYRPPGGCLITIQINRVQQMPIENYKFGSFVMYPFEGADEVREIIDLYKSFTYKEKENIKEDGSEIILVDQKDALKEVIFSSENVGRYVTVKIPTENKLYIFKSTELSEACGEKFNEFLETVSIK
jgi:hypothetical protein